MGKVGTALLGEDVLSRIINLVNLTPDSNIYEEVGKLYKSICNGTHVIVNKFLPPDQSCIKALAGFDDIESKLNEIVGRNPAGMIINIYEGQKCSAMLDTGLIELEADYYKLSSGLFSREQSNQLLKLLKTKFIYSIGFFNGGNRIGSCTFLSRVKFSATKKNSLVEIAHLVSAVLDKRTIILELMKNESQFRAIFEKSNDAIALYKDDKFVLVNDAFINLFKYNSKDEIQGLPIINLIAPEERDLIAKLGARRNKGEDVIEKYETTGITKDNEEIEISVTVSTFNYRNEKYFFVTLRDVTRRNIIERALAESEERLRTLINSTPDSICFKDPEGRWLLANNAKIKMFGLEEINYKGKTGDQIAKLSKLFEFANNRCNETDSLAWEKKELIRCEEIVKYPDGTEQTFDVLKQPLFEKDGSRKALVILGRNITERINNERELKNYRNHLEDLVDERAKELIKTINSLSVEVSNRKMIEELIKYQNSLGSDLLKADSISEVINLGANTFRNIFRNSVVAAIRWGSDKSILALSSGNTRIDEALTETLKIFVSQKKNLILNKEVEDLPEKLNREVKTAGYLKYSLIPIRVKNTTVATYFVIRKDADKLLNSSIDAIEAISAQLRVAFGNLRSKKDLEASENKWHMLYENLPGGTFVVNNDCIIEDVNDIFCKICGYEKEDLIGKSCDIICPAGKEHCPLIQKGAKQINNSETTLIKKNGEQLPIIKSVRRIPFNSQEYIVENFQDISRQKKLEVRLASINKVFLQFGPDSKANINLLTKLLGELLNATCALYNCIDSGMLCSIGVWNAPDDYDPVDKPEGHICYDVINSGSNNLFVVRNLKNTKYIESDPNVKKYQLDTYIGKAVSCHGEIVGSICAVFQSDYIPTDDDIEIFGIIASALGVEEERRKSAQQLEKYRARLEEMVKERTRELTKANQKLEREIADKELTEFALQRSEQEYRGLFENAHEAFILFDCSSGQVLEVNDKAAQLFDLDHEQFKKKNLDFVFQEKSSEIVEYMLQGKGIPHLNFEMFELNKAGEELYLDVNTSNQTYHGRDVVLCTIRDVSERKKTQRQLEKSRENYEQIVQNATDIILKLDVRGRVNFVNPIGSYKLGYKVDEIIGKHFINFIDANYRKKALRFYDHQIKNEIQNTYYEIPVITKRGSIIWLGQNVQLIHEDHEVTGIQAVSRDITQQKYAEDALRESESRFRIMAESISNVAIFGFDIDRKIIFWNSACENLYGYSAEEALGEDIMELIFAEHDKKKFLRNMDNALGPDQKWPVVENEIIKKDRSKISVLSNKVKLSTGSGRIEFYALDIDLTKRKEAELSLQNAKRLAEEANRAKSNFLTNISHELRTPLNGILGYAQTLQNDRSLGDKQREGLNVIEKSGNHLLTLIEDILDLSKIESKKLKLNPHRFDFLEFLKNTAALFRLRAEQKRLHFNLVTDSRLPKIIEADEKYLGQVLFNLLSNAIKFTEKGEVRFTAEVKGKKVRFTVSDTGIGIPQDQMNEIFSPFAQGLSGTVKNEGTGLGLTISKRLVKMMGGQLKVESKKNSGSEFWFELSLAEKEPRVTFNNDDADNIVRYKCDKKFSVLVVDDDFANRRLLKNVFSEMGVNITEAENGSEGLRKTIDEKPDLVLMDIMMPGIDGLTVTKRIREQVEAETPVIIALTASSSEKVKREAIKVGCNDFVAKPIIFAKLFKTVSKYFEITKIEERKTEKLVSHLSTGGKDEYVISEKLFNELMQTVNQGDINKLKEIVKVMEKDNSKKKLAEKINLYLKEFQINNLRKFLVSLEKEK